MTSEVKNPSSHIDLRGGPGEGGGTPPPPTSPNVEGLLHRLYTSPYLAGPHSRCEIRGGRVMSAVVRSRLCWPITQKTRIDPHYWYSAAAAQWMAPHLQGLSGGQAIRPPWFSWPDDPDNTLIDYILCLWPLCTICSHGYDLCTIRLNAHCFHYSGM